MDTSIVTSVLLHNYLDVLSISILYYDHAITLGTEVSYFWIEPKTRSLYFFLLNRYLGLLGNVVVTIFNFYPLSLSGCLKYYWLREIVFLTNQILVCVLLALRTYALYGRRAFVLAILTVTALIALGVAFWFLIGQKSVPQPQLQSGCHFGLSTEMGIRIAIPWEMLFVYDSMIFAFTFFKSYQGRHEEFGSLLATQIFRDGSVYFVVMLLSHLGNILTFYMVNPLLGGCLSTFTSNVSIMMMSRLAFNLREVMDVDVTPTCSEPQLTTIHFSPSHGAPVVIPGTSASACV